MASQIEDGRIVLVYVARDPRAWHVPCIEAEDIVLEACGTVARSWHSACIDGHAQLVLRPRCFVADQFVEGRVMYEPSPIRGWASSRTSPIPCSKARRWRAASSMVLRCET